MTDFKTIRNPGMSRRCSPKWVRRLVFLGVVSVFLLTVQACTRHQTIVADRMIPVCPEAPSDLFEQPPRFVQSETLGRFVEAPFLVSLGDVTMPALLITEDDAQTWSFEARAGDRLGFSLASTAGVAAGATATVSLSDPGERVLHSVDLTPSTGDDAMWEHFEIPLPVKTSGPVTLTFAVERAKQSPPGCACLLLGNPIIVRTVPSEVKPSLILISVDTLRADHLSWYGYDRRTSPNLDAFFGTNGIGFDHVVAGAPWTLPSHVTMLSGTDPLRHGANYDSIPSPSETDLLAEILRDEGYATAAWTGGGFLAPRFGFSPGFDQYTSFPRSRMNHELAENVVAAQQWILDHKATRFFVFLHTYEVHPPLHPREPHFARFNRLESPFDGRATISKGTPTEATLYRRKNQFLLSEAGEQRPVAGADWHRIVDLYDAQIAFMDATVGRFLEDLTAAGILEETLVVLTSDHGESFGEKGLVGHGNLHDSNLMVPLLMAGPGIPSGGRRIEDQVGLVDVTPTILDLLHIERNRPVDGRSLLPVIHGGDVESKHPGLSGVTPRRRTTA